MITIRLIKEKLVKITNRLTGASVWAVLYAEKKLGDDIHTVYPSVKEGLSRDQQLRIRHTAANGDFEWKDLDLRGMQVQLIEKKEVKKFDTFETAESEEGLFTFEFLRLLKQTTDCMLQQQEIKDRKD